MIIASAMAFISYKSKQSFVIDYIVVGIIIGPHTSPFSLILNQDILTYFLKGIPPFCYLLLVWNFL